MTIALRSSIARGAPRLQIRWRASAAAVTEMRWSPDARVLAVATRGGAVLLLNGETGATLALLTEHAGGATSLAWRPCGRVLATSGNDGTMRCFDRASLDLILEVDTEGSRAAGLAWSDDGAYLSARVAGIPTVWSLEARVRPLKRRLARCIAWHPTERRLFVADATRISSQTIDGKPSAVTFASPAPILSLAVRPDAAYLAALTSQGPAVWDLATHALRVAPAARAERAPAPMAWSPTMPWLIAARGGEIRIWPMGGDRPADPVAIGAHAGAITALTPLPCGRRFVSSGTDGALHLWCVDLPSPRATGRHPAPLTLLASTAATAVAASTDDRLTAWAL